MTQNHTGTPTRYIDVAEIPVLMRSYASAISSSIGSKLTGRTPDLQLSDIGVRVTGHRFSATDLTEYRRVFGTADDGIMPSVAVHIAAFPVMMHLMTRDDFPLPLLGLVHTHNHVEHHHPVQTDQPVTITAWAQNLAPHRSGTTADLRVQVHRDDDDVLLWGSTSTFLARGIRLPEQSSGHDAAQHRRDEFSPPVKTAQWRLDADAGRIYGQLSGDVNPIHINPLAAKALGMKSMIAHGMYLAGRMLSGREPKNAGFTWDIEFKTPVTLPGTVTVAFEHPGPNQTVCTGWNAPKNKPHFIGQILA